MALLRVLCWALIFVLRLRFPPGSSLVTILKKRYNNDSLAAFRKFRRVELELGKAKLDLFFLSNCKKRSIVPRFLWLKVANRRLRNSSAYRQCQNKLLQEEISKHARIRILSAQSTVAYSNLPGLVSTIDFILLKTLSDRENSKKLTQHQRIQDRKLFRLCSDSKTTNTINPNDVIFNFSNRLISDEDKEILSRSLNVCIPQKSLNHCNVLTPFELCYQKLKREPIGHSSRHYPDFIKTKLKDIAHSELRSYHRPSFVFSEEGLK